MVGTLQNLLWIPPLFAARLQPISSSTNTHIQGLFKRGNVNWCDVDRAVSNDGKTAMSHNPLFRA